MRGEAAMKLCSEPERWPLTPTLSPTFVGERERKSCAIPHASRAREAGAVAAKADVSVADVKVHAVERPKPEGFG